MRLRILFLLSLAWLAACGEKDALLAPAPLPAFEPAAKIVRLWSVDTGAGAAVVGLRLAPAVTGDAVYVVDARGRVSARARADGHELWRRNTGEAFSAGPVAGYGQLFAGTREGELVAMSATDGTVVWRAQLTGEVLAPPALDGDAVIVKSADGRVTLFDRASGAVRWVYDGGLPPLTLRASSRPLLLPDAAIVGLSSGVLVALERAGGQVIWERRVAEPAGKSELDRLVDIAGDFLLVGDRLHAASYQGSIVAMDLRSGQFEWQQPVSTFQPLAAGDGNIYVVDADSHIVAYRASDGVVVWRLESLRGRQVAGAAVTGSWLLVGDYQGWLHVIRQTDGMIVARLRVDRAGIAAVPVVDESTVFVLGQGGRLAALKVE